MSNVTPRQIVRTDPWLIVRVATRREKRALESMREVKLTCFSPSRIAWSHLGRMPEAKPYPLFSGYAFVQIPEGHSLYEIGNLDGVVGFVWIAGRSGDKRAATLSNQDVEALIWCEMFGLFNETWVAPWKPEKGEMVQVCDGGPMDGFIGKAVKVKGANRIKVLFDHLGASNMDISQVQPPDIARPQAA